MKKFWKKHAGFTLVELIVVIAILGVLTGVAVPVYSGYVKKANLAADQTLLDSVNTAFAAACLENGENISDVTRDEAKLKIDETSKTVNVDESILVPEIPAVKTSFGKYFGTDSSTQFKVLTTSDIQFENGMFKIINLGVYANLTFADDLINKVKESAFFTAPGLGVDNLVSKVSYITDLAASLADPGANEGAGNGAWQMLAPYYKDVAMAVGDELPDGFDAMDGEEKNSYLTSYNGLVAEKVAALNAQGGNGIEGWSSMDDVQKNMYAQKMILSNYAVLDAAKGMKGQEPEDVLETIRTTSNFKDLIKDTSNESGVAYASAAYGLYTAYAYALDENDPARAEAIAKLDKPTDLLSAMDDPGFRAYLADEESGKAKADLAGYMATMEMIDSSSSNQDAVRELLLNGFADPALLAKIQQSMK